MDVKQALFEAVTTGSVKDVENLITSNGKATIIELSSAFNELGETPLLLAVKRNHKEMVKFLVEELSAWTGQTGRLLWKEVDYQGVPPLFAALLHDRTFGLPLVSFLIEKDQQRADEADPGFHRPFDLHYISLSSSMPRMQKIDVLELIGAAYILEVYEVPEPILRRLLVESAIMCWGRAIAIRNSTLNDEPPIPKNPLEINERFKQLCGCDSEFTTTIELLDILDEASQESSHVLQIQALLVVYRIMSRIDPEANPYFLTKFCKNRVLLLHHHERIPDVASGPFTVLKQVANSFLFILAHLKCNQWVTNDPLWAIPMASAVFCEIYSVFKRVVLLIQHANSPAVPQQHCLSYLVINLLKTIWFANSFYFSFVGKSWHLENQDGMIRRLSYVVSVIIQLLSNIVAILRRFLRKEFLAIYRLLIDGDVGVPTLLHWLVYMKKVPVDIIEMFLEAGANPNAVDLNGNTPLHVLAMNLNADVEDTRKAAKLLLDSGCHFDQVNNYGFTALTLLRKIQSDDGYAPNANAYPSPFFEHVVLPLSCCCAQVIIKNQIPFENRIPVGLNSFIREHDDTDEKKFNSKIVIQRVPQWGNNAVVHLMMGK